MQQMTIFGTMFFAGLFLLLPGLGEKFLSRGAPRREILRRPRAPAGIELSRAALANGLLKFDLDSLAVQASARDVVFKTGGLP